jgi:hypothetical protein
LLATVCTLAVVTGWTSPVRVVFSLGFLILAPGLALAELLELSDLAQRLTIAIGASLALDALVAMTLLYAGAYSARLAVGILAALTLTVLAVALVRAHTHSRKSATSSET